MLYLRDSPNNVFKDMTYTMACQVTRSFANRACLGRAGKATAAVPRYRRIKMQRLWQDLPISDLIDSMLRRISACIAARGGFALTDF
ncbi:hypothetical protein TNCV_3384971 [Trichonephila clavipes]|uniref:Uncharacterized protein n=1 Tax=Trichonephila clavipes TaxID=2585209 RepID=A0A8X6VLT6_TRICX|nr:hypothetical protein TNCV_3384971 [Trichonephila clavipes]